MYRLFLFIILCINIIIKSFAINPTNIAKYPFVLVGDDYGILTEQDMMEDENYGSTVDPLNYNDPIKSDRYWKCYKTSDLSFKYWDSKFNKKLDDYHVGGLIIYVLDNNGILNAYDMRRALSIDVRDKFLKKWRQLIKNQTYLCIHGDFVSNEIELYMEKTDKYMAGFLIN